MSLANEVANEYLQFMEWATFQRGRYADEWLNIEDFLSPIQSSFSAAYQRLYDTGRAPSPNWYDAIDTDESGKNFRLTPVPHRQRPKNIGPIG